MKSYGGWGSGVIAPPFLTSALGGGKWSVSPPKCFAPREIVLGTHWIGGCMMPTTGLDAMEKRNIL
jgi:hypothetical protein